MNTMKQLVVCLFLLLSSTTVVMAQGKIDQFMVDVDGNHNPRIIYSSYGATPRDGVVVINTTIPNLEFGIMSVSKDRLKKVEYDKRKNCYILIIQPNDNNYKRYTITLNAKGFMLGKIENVVVKAGLSSGYIVNKKSNYNAFVSVNYAYGITSQTHSLGATFGKLFFFRNKMGLFLSGSKNLTTVTVAGECDKEGYLSDGSRPLYDDAMITPEWSALFGAYWRFNNFYIQVGSGVGASYVYWKTGGDYYRNLGLSNLEVALTGGVRYHVNKLVLSLDMVTNGFRTAELKVGLGLSF